MEATNDDEQAFEELDVLGAFLSSINNVPSAAAHRETNPIDDARLTRDLMDDNVIGKMFSTVAGARRTLLQNYLDKQATSERHDLALPMILSLARRVVVAPSRIRLTDGKRIGWGLFARDRIPDDTILGIYGGTVVTEPLQESNHAHDRAPAASIMSRKVGGGIREAQCYDYQWVIDMPAASTVIVRVGNESLRELHKETKNLYILGIHMANQLNFINTLPDISGRSYNMRNNVARQLIMWRGVPRIIYFTIRDIEAGEELFAPYGPQHKTATFDRPQGTMVLKSEADKAALNWPRQLIGDKTSKHYKAWITSIERATALIEASRAARSPGLYPESAPISRDPKKASTVIDDSSSSAPQSVVSSNSKSKEKQPTVRRIVRVKESKAAVAKTTTPQKQHEYERIESKSISKLSLSLDAMEEEVAMMAIVADSQAVPHVVAKVSHKKKPKKVSDNFMPLPPHTPPVQKEEKKQQVTDNDTDAPIEALLTVPVPPEFEDTEDAWRSGFEAGATQRLDDVNRAISDASKTIAKLQNEMEPLRDAHAKRLQVSEFRHVFDTHDRFVRTDVLAASGTGQKQWQDAAALFDQSNNIMAKVTADTASPMRKIMAVERVGISRRDPQNMRFLVAFASREVKWLPLEALVDADNNWVLEPVLERYIEMLKRRETIDLEWTDPDSRADDEPSLSYAEVAKMVRERVAYLRREAGDPEVEEADGEEEDEEDQMDYDM